MNCTRDLQELPGGRRKDKKRLEKGLWAFDVKNSLVMEVIDARKIKTEEELTENIGLPLCVLEKHNPWPAYVTYMSPMVKRLIEKSKARDLECMQALEESQRTLRQNKLASITQLKRKKSSKGPGNLMLKDMRSETMLSVWSSYSVPATGPTAMPEPRHFHTDSRENPTANYNKIIFSRKPMMRLLPYSSLLVSKEKHSSV
ncbi:CMT1A duplicated region transcript 4 protein [Lutra lutra]|uniref:CMT1A duplicated region transcript 4 protein n=1 Tax=Lutra lutra TaxID=9657 RepID=UPI001FD372D5|nr:CMT1A duplicated region transcript 4 protein [Lutra lutra]XP_047565220.1 CMT1A duplicated region transcript 4 protein [Lutra lutra]XP_047565221.1 CMT1A duplicated region transcript 4 protein [Lutra lutra]XP_047565222.1 CMT1A duplicated region transcript 4 protein [Lutra lutra]XP_047565223.1 CMT1A duplicated region transcript 4 protein [Lutra lutra]XP_047565224.1 CMT1A duplicated region transcript 4 protein [Lutra lutra]